MPEPLAIASSVAGLFAASMNIYGIISQIIAVARHVPKIAFSVQQEVENTRIIFGALGNLIENLDAASQGLRPPLVPKDDLLKIRDNGMAIFNDLERLFESIRVEGTPKLWVRITWARKEDELLKMLERLQAFKINILALLVILHSDPGRGQNRRVRDVPARISARLQQNTIGFRQALRIGRLWRRSTPAIQSEPDDSRHAILEGSSYQPAKLLIQPKTTSVFLANIACKSQA